MWCVHDVVCDVYRCDVPPIPIPTISYKHTLYTLYTHSIQTHIPQHTHSPTHTLPNTHIPQHTHSLTLTHTHSHALTHTLHRGALVEQLQDIAHTTITIEQALLTDNTLGLNITAAQAIAIADGALEHAVRGVAAALRVPELLVLSNGGAAWHGKVWCCVLLYCVVLCGVWWVVWYAHLPPSPPLPLPQHPHQARGNLRQRMSTPLQQLLTRPGTFALGRGLAGLQHAAAASLPGSTTGADATALQCMAADAVAAAADSPFLQGGLKDAAGLLCCISLPGEVGGGFGGGGVGGKGGKGGTAARLAVQAAAGSLMEALGSAPVAKNMLICAHHVPVDAVEGYGFVCMWVCILEC